ncbi:MAG: hypothetical protein ACREBR_03235 [bacterium]
MALVDGLLVAFIDGVHGRRERMAFMGGVSGWRSWVALVDGIHGWRSLMAGADGIHGWRSVIAGQTPLSLALVSIFVFFFNSLQRWIKLVALQFVFCLFLL